MWLLIPFSGAKWAVGDFKWMWKKHYNSIEFYKTTWWVMAEMLVFKAVFLMYSLIIPFSLHPIGKAAFLVGVFVWTNGTLFILNFAVNHLLEENIFPDELTVERDWAKLQVLTSSNYATNSIFWTLFSGGLNHQIEHHVSVLHLYNHYPAVSCCVSHIFARNCSYCSTGLQRLWSALHQQRYLLESIDQLL